MFKKILVANRGEIACRIIKTARKMGIKTVAVYSDADARALHTEMADEKVRVGPAAVSESYLRPEIIIAACKQTRAEAVHPGYGFLSERASFAKMLSEAGIVFIGPNAYAIEAMGDKIESKKAAAAAGVSTVPGDLGVIESVNDARKIAGKIGYPVMIKASAGGGGKGMRIAHSAEDVEEGFARARSEAKSSFGDDRVFIEKFIENPRHIEIQVLGDKHGNIIYLGERECSIQRRNQKVVEEAPSPLLDAETRKAMGEQAVALARAVGYDSAGTVEFVAGQDRSFYFLEMNTRLQVEHPVTELITGIDLVEHMIRVAAGEKLQLSQSDVQLNGWAIESRIYAEDPYRNFLPSTGRLSTYCPPLESPTVRNDTGVFEGGEIPIWYDPMIAKLCTHAPTRADAIDKMAEALDQFAIEGIQHNIPFLAAIMQNATWQSGKLSTGFISEEFPEGFKGIEPTQQNQRILAKVAALLDHNENGRRRHISGQLDGRPVHFSHQREVRIGDQWFKFEVTPDFEHEVSGVQRQAGQPCVSATIEGQAITVQVKRLVNGYRITWRGISVDAFAYSEKEAGFARLMPVKKLADTSNKLFCPMPGLVRSILVSEGQRVKSGDPLVVVEAMKMENMLRAERDAVVAKVLAKMGDSLAVDAVIMEFERTA